MIAFVSSRAKTQYNPFAFSAVILLAIGMAGCSSAPMTRGSVFYYGPTRDIHEAVRARQNQQFGGRLIDTQQSLESLQAGLETEDCYKLTQTYTQWGIYQPETVFLGEGVFNSSNKAYIFVTPTFEEKEIYISPREAGGLRAYRIDADAPFSAPLVRQLETILGKSEFCVKLARLENQGEKNPQYAVIATSVQLTSKATAPKVKAPVAPETPATTPPTTEEKAKTEPAPTSESTTPKK